MAASHQRPPRSAGRQLPFGFVTGIVGTEVLCADGKNFSLEDMLGKGCVGNSRGAYELISDLIGENALLRKLVVELVRDRGPKIVEPNEFHRSIASLAGKIDEHPDDIRAIVEPILRQLIDEMLAKQPEKARLRDQTRRGVHPNDSRREFVERTRDRGY